MAKGDRKGNQGGAHAPEQTNSIEQPPEGPTGSQDPHDDGAAEVSNATATEMTPGEPGPEDFEQHKGDRLRSDHGADLRLLDEVEKRLRKRGHVIATRLRKSGVNATAEINGVQYVARQRPRCPGEMMLSEAVSHVNATLD